MIICRKCKIYIFSIPLRPWIWVDVDRARHFSHWASSCWYGCYCVTARLLPAAQGTARLSNSPLPHTKPVLDEWGRSYSLPK